MLQGLDIPWGVMVDTWDLTFSSTSDVPDRLDLCPTSICNIFLVASSLSLLCTWPNHLNLLSEEFRHRVHVCLVPDVYISHMV